MSIFHRLNMDMGKSLYSISVNGITSVGDVLVINQHQQETRKKKLYFFICHFRNYCNVLVIDIFY